MTDSSSFTQMAAAHSGRLYGASTTTATKTDTPPTPTTSTAASTSPESRPRLNTSDGINGGVLLNSNLDSSRRSSSSSQSPSQTSPEPPPAPVAKLNSDDLGELQSHPRLVPLQLASSAPVSPRTNLAPNKIIQEHPRATSVTSQAVRGLPPAASNSSPPRQNSRSRLSASSISPRSVPSPSQAAREAAYHHHHSSPPSKPTDAKSTTRRAPASCSANGVATSGGPPLTLNTYRLQSRGAVVHSSPASTPEKPEAESPGGQQDLSLPKSRSLSSQSSSPDDEQSPTLRRPPISYRLSANSAAAQSGTSSPIRVPPIRSFRSSGSRKSLLLDMNYRSYPTEMARDTADSNNEDTIRNTARLNGLDQLYVTGSGSARQREPPADDTGEIFLKIAREDPSRYSDQDNTLEDTQNASVPSRRSSHRRNLSTNIASFQPVSPPRASRRLSDQQDRPRMRQDDDQTSEISRSATFRSKVRDRPASSHPAEDAGYHRGGGAILRPSPLVPRSSIEHDSDPSVYPRRRSSVADGSSALHSRAPTYRSGHNYSKTYSPSPLVRSFELQSNRGSEGVLGVDGTESTVSTTAPSTVWDELDDLKSRMNRLELTGKLPSSSSAAISKAADERPTTATTTVTTASLSPKRPTGAPQVDTTSTSFSQREAQPILQSTLARSKPYMSSEVFQALESAANDAIGLSSMVGGSYQSGTLSGAASTIGTGQGVTDRQLRRKADSLCRSLTELCVTLGDGQSHSTASQQSRALATPQSEGPATPTMAKSFNVLPTQHRQTAAEHSIPKSTSSPRPLSKFEERRNNILNGSSIPSPRPIAVSPSIITEPNLNRRSSLLVSRTRRAGTEEPEDGRQSSAALRFKRAVTEEPDEGRKTSLLRSRRGTLGEESEEPRFQPPSRANTDLNTARNAARDYALEAQSQAPDTASQVSSTTPRRRFVSSNLHSSRLVTPASTSGAPPRKYLERAPLDRDAGGDQQSRRLSLGHAMSHARAGSMNWRQNRNSAINPGSPTR